MNGDSVTILRCAHPQIAAKTHTRSGDLIDSKPAANAKYWTVEERSVRGIEELGNLLTEISEDRCAAVIRGRPRAGTTGQRVRRTSSGRDATFEGQLHHWVAFDIDSLSSPHVDVVEEPDHALRWAADELARWIPELDGASFYAQLSGSAGIRDRQTVKCHLWYWLKSPCSDAELKRLARGVKAEAGFAVIDIALYQAVQLHFTARAVFVNMPDPIPGARRWLAYRGHTDEVELTIPAAAPKRTARASGTVPSDHLDGSGFDYHLARIDGDGEHGLRRPALSALGAVVKERGSALAWETRDQILAKVSDALSKAKRGGRAEATVQKYIDDLPDMLIWVLNRQWELEQAALCLTPTYPLDSAVSLATGAAQLKAVIAAFFVIATTQRRIKCGNDFFVMFPAPVRHCVRADIGLGKTRDVREWIAAMHQRGELAPQVVYFVPNHRLSADLEQEYRSAGIDVRRYLGREAQDPDDHDQKMCVELGLVKAAARHGIDAEDVCGVCPSRDNCSYMKQRKLPEPAVALIAQNFLTQPPPKMAKHAKILVIDERCDRHFGGENWTLLETTLAETRTHEREGAVADLTEVQDKVRKVLAQVPDGGVLTRAMCDGLTCDDLDRHIDSERRLRPRLENKGGDAAALTAELKAKPVRYTRALPALFCCIRDFLDSGCFESCIRRVQVDAGELGSGSGFEFWTERKLHEAWEHKPILIIDATMNFDLVHWRFRGAELKASITVERPCTYVMQLDVELPTSALIDHKTGDAQLKLHQAADRIEVIARSSYRRCPGEWDVLVVCATKKVHAALTALLAGRDSLERVALRHHGDLVGLNIYENVGDVVLLGRPLPPALALEIEAQSLQGTKVAASGGDGRYPRAMKALAMRDGTAYAVEVETHPDPLVAALLEQTVHAQLLQAVGRAREIRRRPENPVRLHIWTAVPLRGIPVDEVVDWDRVVVDPLELAIARHGVLPLRPRDLVRTGLWMTKKAASRHLERGEKTPSALIERYIGGAGVFELEYRSSSRSKWSRALAPVGTTHTDAAKKLRALTGEPGLSIRVRVGDAYEAA